MLRRLVFGMIAIILGSTLLNGQAAPPTGSKPDTESISADVRSALQKLDASSDNTAASRITLAKVAIEHNAWEAAHEVLLDAARLEPGNKEVADLIQKVVKNLPPPPPPATNPASMPATKPVGPATKSAATAFTVVREVTAGEINRIRQLEWRPDEKPAPIIRVEPDTKKKFLAIQTDVTPSDFNKMTSDAQAALILASGQAELYNGVQIKTDPASLKDFKTTVNTIVVKNCGSCHVANKAGRFSLYTDRNDAAIYTNFLILQNYTAVVNGAERLMVDRTNPEGSLLAQFMLLDKITDLPHPATPDFKAPAKTTSDPKYQFVLKWLKSLDSIAPKYGIDVSKPEDPAKPAAKGG